MDPDAIWGGEWVGRGMGALDGDGDSRRGRDSFGGEFGASHCNQWAFATRSFQITLRTCYFILR